MNSRLSGKVVLVTGSTRGIGRAIAMQCADEGARVCVTGRTQAAGEEVAAEIEQRSGQAFFVRTDVTDEVQVRNAVGLTVERWGQLDGLVCNAAAMDLTKVDGPVSESELDNWNRIILADLTSVFLAAKHGIKAMLDGPGALWF
jgi:NAD(P)-dependent dehydrogenase (short-subunit alcohol dehydrogenase family)